MEKDIQYDGCIDQIYLLCFIYLIMMICYVIETVGKARDKKNAKKVSIYYYSYLIEQVGGE